MWKHNQPGWAKFSLPSKFFFSWTFFENVKLICFRLLSKRRLVSTWFDSRVCSFRVLDRPGAAPRRFSPNMNQRESLRISENSLNFIQYSSNEKIQRCYIDWHSMTFHWISKTLTDSYWVLHIRRTQRSCWRKPSSCSKQSIWKFILSNVDC